ncbi:XRE family transcriptional regulator [Cupriavidus necator]|uniref:XRE family transcriptional regulator n=2 Tax=Cupriavidus necator TaxID=106590 RepID=A0A1U9UZF9_CUPNE|nr:XRE family transcriptional regulator [Cupriavidus necator]
MSTFLAACEALGLEVVLAPQHLAADVNAFIASRNGGVTAASMAGQPAGSAAAPAAAPASGGSFGSGAGEGHKPV